MNILITGATGFIGKHLVKALQDRNYNIFAIVRKKSDLSNLKKIGIKYHIDSGRLNDIKVFLKQHNIEGLIHLASYFIAEHTTKDIDQLIESNLTFGTRLLEAVRETKIKWFINTGTAWQHFGNQGKYCPTNLYAATKEAFQILSEYYTAISPLIFVTLKICDTYGNNDTRKKIFNLWCDSIKTGSKLDMSPGDQKLDIVHIDDVVSAYLLLIKSIESNGKANLQGESFSVTSGDLISLRDLSAVFQKVISKKVEINWGERDYRAREIMIPWQSKNTVPSWNPTVSLETGIKRLMKEIM